ncbi:uncharacterized protein BP5553_07119 [Venustampulla echinocandica]|uniref:4-hydroxybenzoate polyprenyltransferase, mitochondrial n=1 Tax=Venustampulla echinocandica TaxID=2656787 RepID=A0A370TIK6_9HELO|nr:uncharacterized protein BP5553_07119 [Venustampulla echinocandica]RDL35188.1 hypothetical protein BP5553_07119 [Venustampulla echinocandica]
MSSLPARKPIDSKCSSGPTYYPPSTGLVSYLPSSFVPYAELMRLDRPAGIYLFFVPHLLGTLYAAALSPNDIRVQSLLQTLLILYAGTVFMRGAACSWNDNLDQEYDRQVYRCKTRPIARGAVSTVKGHIFTAFLTAIAAGFLMLLPRTVIPYAIPSIFLLWLYPFTKRFTDYPQIILGLQMSLGVFVGIVATGVDPMEQPLPKQISMIALYGALVTWTVIYDTIYACQDSKDDAKAGVKSMAVRFLPWMRPMLWGCAAVMVSLLVTCGIEAGFSEGYYLFMGCGGVTLSLTAMIGTVNLDDPASCLWWFKNTYWQVATPLSLGFLAEYAA